MNYSIKNTSRDERKKIAKNALAISVGCDEMPSEEAINAVKEYVNGDAEIEDIQKKIIERYKKL